VDIQFIPEAEKDYKSLDGSIKKLVNEKIDKLKDDAYIGEELGNKNNIEMIIKSICRITGLLTYYCLIAILLFKHPQAVKAGLVLGCRFGLRFLQVLPAVLFLFGIIFPVSVL